MSFPIAGAATAILALAACAAAQPPQRGATPGYMCDNHRLAGFIGQQATQELGEQMLHESGSRTLRWLRPGMIVTMEFSPERLTVRLDSAGRVLSANCG